MTQTCEGPPRWSADGPLELSSYGGINLQVNIPNQAPSQEDNRAPDVSGAAKRAPNPAVAAAIKDLTAEYAVEAARIASIYAAHFVEDMGIGDLWAAEHDMRGAVLHLREAAAKFREWQGKPLPALGGVA
jgi:hypothetical protein